MKKVSRIWLWLFLIFLGFSGGIVTGVIVDVDTVYETTIEKIKQKRSPGGEIIVDVDVTNPQPKSNKEIRKEERDAKKNQRQVDRQTRKASRKLKREHT